MSGLGAIRLAAQDKDVPSKSAESTNSATQEAQSKNQHDKSVQPYRLDFTFNELEDGKKINSRHYSIDVTAGSANETKIGTRVPVSIGPQSQYQYMDVGTNIWANLREGGDEVQLEVRSDMSNLDMSSAHDHYTGSAPIVRQIQINGSTLLVTGKSIVIGAVDDPNSNREFQLEVTATKLR
jgi:hypothetical protein